jgi:hypothetical protein
MVGATAATNGEPAMATCRTATVVAVATLLVLPPLAGPALAHHARGCGDHVRREGRTFRVLPTDVDDTDNIQCAFDQATLAGPGMTVRLVAGTYVTRQIVIRDFEGAFRGEGPDVTIVTNPEEPMPVARTRWYLAEPGRERPWPVLFTALHSAIAVSDAAFRIRGAAPLQGWTGGSECDTEATAPCVNDLAAVFFVGPDWSRPDRNQGSATFRRVVVEGERNGRLWPEPGGSYFGYNAISGIYAFGNPLRGTLELSSSTVRTIYDAVQVEVLLHSRVSVRRNLFDDVGGATFADLAGSRLDFASNEVRVSPDQRAPLGLSLHDDVEGFESSSLLVRHNLFEGPIGIRVPATFKDGVSCLLYDNDVERVTGVGIHLGPGTRGCRVLGTPLDRVLDEGTNNRIGGRWR